MPLALALDDLAARLAGTDAVALREGDPTQRAYALREAVSVTRPDVLLVGWGADEQDAALAALAGGATGDDLVDVLYDAPPLAQAPPLAGLLETVGVLAGIYSASGPRIAVVLRGPCSTAVELGSAAGDEAAEVVADALAALVRAVADAGATFVVLVEDLAEPLGSVAAPVLRALEHLGVDGVVAVTVAEAGSAPPPGSDAGAGAGPGAPAVRRAVRWDLAGAPPPAALVDPAVLTAADAAAMVAELRAAAARGALVLAAGQVPADVALEALVP